MFVCFFFLKALTVGVFAATLLMFVEIWLLIISGHNDEKKEKKRQVKKFYDLPEPKSTNTQTITTTTSTTESKKEISLTTKKNQ